MTYRRGHPRELGITSAEVSLFYRTFWPKRTPIGSLDYYRYLFEEGDAEATIVITAETGNILGAMAARHRPFRLADGTELTGAEMSTWLVHPDHQSKGIGPQILQTFKERFQFLLGCSITPAAQMIYARSGFAWRPALPRVIYSPDWQVLQPFMEQAPLCKKVARARASERVPTSAIRVELSDTCPEVHVRHIGHSFVRTPEYYRWRYENNPFFRYRWARKVGANTSLLVVYRIEKIGDLTALRVVELSGHETDWPMLPYFLETLCEMESAAVIDFFCSNQRVMAAFTGSPWLRIPDEQGLCDFPHLLAPPSPQAVNSYSYVFWMTPDHSDHFSEDVLTITKQDSDMDRLGVLADG